MQEPDLRHVEALFQAAADLPLAERAAFLDSKGPAPDVRRKVEAMLDQLERDETLASPVNGALDAAVMTEGEGAAIDRYRLLQALGEGGFGVVWLAEQREPVLRQVALKIIKLGMDTREVVARFEAERQALAMMDHPNIARVLDGGATAAGRPYFVMELVRGLSITRYCDEHNLSMRQRLELFIDVCHAVQHAHQKGVIHRDLKPSNVMVTVQDGRPVPKVIDFGVAKAMHTRLTDKTLFTAFGRFIGTPAYMSPEQAEMTGLDVDTRSDIYSLGVLLYELLTGTTPFEAASMVRGGLAEIQRVLREEQPPRPSLRIFSSGSAQVAARRSLEVRELSRSVRGELDWIVMKAMDKDPARRYASTHELAADIRRHLDGDPILAGEPSRTYRLRKLLARHRAAVGSAAAILLALIAGIVGTSLGMLEAARQRDAARREAQHASVVTDFLVNTLALADPDVVQDPDLSVRTLLNRAVLQLDQAFDGRPAAEAGIRATIGRAFESLGEWEQAEHNLRLAVELTDEAGDYDPAEFYLTLWRLTHVLFKLEREDAFTTANRARQVAHDHIAASHPALGASLERFLNTVQEAVHEPEGDAMDRARAQFTEVGRLLDETLQPGDPLWPIVADTFMDAGYTVWYTSLEPANADYFAKALEIQRRELPASHPDVAESVSQLVGVLNRAGRSEEAEARARESLALLSEVYDEDSFRLAFPRAMLGQNLVLQGRYAEAEPVLLHSHRVLLEHAEDEASFYVVDSHKRLIELYEGWGLEQRARPYREALLRIAGETPYPLAWNMSRLAFGPEHAELATRLARMEELCGALFYSAREGEIDSPEADRLVAEIVERRRAGFDDEDPLSAAIGRLFVGWAHTLSPGNPTKRVMAEEALRVLKPGDGRAAIEAAEAWTMLAEVASVEGDDETAHELARRAVDWLPEKSRQDWLTANAKTRISRCLTRVGLREEAERILRSGHAVLMVQLGPNNPNTQEAQALLDELNADD